MVQKDYSQIVMIWAQKGLLEEGPLTLLFFQNQCSNKSHKNSKPVQLSNINLKKVIILFSSKKEIIANDFLAASPLQKIVYNWDIYLEHH